MGVAPVCGKLKHSWHGKGKQSSYPQLSQYLVHEQRETESKNRCREMVVQLFLVALTNF